jgi:hypothetical protein
MSSFFFIIPSLIALAYFFKAKDSGKDQQVRNTKKAALT